MLGDVVVPENKEPFTKGARSVELCIKGISKLYRGNVLALRDFNLTLGPGVLGLLGPNGAGKSTLMKIIATLTQPSEGIITWDGIDIHREPNSLRARLGYLPQDFGVYPHLNAREFLEYLAAAKGMSSQDARRRIDALLEAVNLSAVGRRVLGGFSGGMKQRVGIAAALLNDPLVLIVDEPTAGLDPEERVRFRHLLSELAGERVVILSSHIVSDIEAVATHVAIVSKGTLLREAAPERLLQDMEGRVWEWTVQSEELIATRNRWLVSGAVRRTDGVQIRAVSSTRPADSARPVAPTLEDAYLDCLVGSRIRSAA